MPAPTPVIEALDADAARREQAPLVALLQNVVDDGGSVGFLPPLSAEEAREYWESVAVAVKGGWTFVGAIPQYARSANRALHATALYYLLIGERHDQ